MGRALLLLILAVAAAGAAGCKADRASQASSEMDKRVVPAQRAEPVQTAAPAQAQEAKPSPLDARPVIVCFGDSLTAGYGADDGQSYPDFLQRGLDRDGYHYRVINEGVSGNTTKDGIDRISDVIAEHPQVVVLEFGGNDGLRGFKVATTRTNLAAMIQRLKQAGIKVLLAGITLPPDYGKDYVDQFTQSYPLLAGRYGVPLLPFLLQNVYGVNGMMQADGIHATDRGNAIVANNVLPLLEPMLKK